MHDGSDGEEYDKKPAWHRARVIRVEVEVCEALLDHFEDVLTCRTRVKGGKEDMKDCGAPSLVRRRWPYL